jgi:hypothetical protein
MKQFFELVIVIPIGPKVEPEFIIDTVESIIYYTESIYKIILVDDSQTGIGTEVQQQFPDSDLIFTPRNYGRNGGLYLTLSLAFRYAIIHYHFSALLKIDTDALVIGPQPEKEAISLFKNKPGIGMAGQYGLAYNGEPWDISWPRSRIIAGTSTWRYIHRPVANWILRKVYKRALTKGYITGESVFGGAYFMSEPCLLALYEEGFLPESRLGTLSLEEDHIFSLLVKAIDFQLADLSAGQLPFGCSWRGLPNAPDQLLLTGKKIIHSTRYWKDMKEGEIRQYFRQQRQVKHLDVMQ